MTSVNDSAPDAAARDQALRQWLARSGSARSATIAAADRSAPLRASFGQRRLWAQDRADEVGGRRNIPLAWRLHGDLDTDALFGALDLIVSRHEALRTSLHEHDAELWQTVQPPYPLERAVVPAGPDVARQVDDFVYSPIDLASGRLLRALLVRVGPREHILVLATVHLVLDDWTAGVLWTELSTAYTALRAGDEPRLPALAIQYPD
ncbi:condensation domain-containing protein, partial [Actinoplanes philippinensis]|uniref:condensation domain-containing protein n=1 Tax=Actinoplanes philippinensis TaxID=35752 RepID=UPI0033E16ED5